MAHEASIREAFEDFVEDKLDEGARPAIIHFYRSNIEHLFGAGERRGSTELALQSFFPADTSTQRTPLLPSWSAITVSAGALLSSTTVPPAARMAAIRCSATSGAT